MGVLALLVPAGPGGAALAVSFEEARDWLKAEHEAARAWPGPGTNLYFDIEVEKHIRVDPAELARTREIVSKYEFGPERHPLAAQLANMERWARGPERERRRGWIRDRDNWRINSDFIDDPSGFFNDAVLVDGLSMLMSRGELALFDPGRGFPSDRAVPALRGLLFDHARSMLFGGIGQYAPGEPDPSSFRQTPQGFEMVVRPASGAGAAWRVSVQWSAPERRGYVLEAGVLELPSAAYERASIITGPWEPSEVVGRRISTTASFLRPDGQVAFVASLHNVSALDRREFRKVTSLPSAESGDLIRGKVFPDTVHDFRDNPHQIKFVPAEVALAAAEPSWGMWAAIGGAGIVFSLAPVLFRLWRGHQHGAERR
ncbi:MAG: hypothetical protein SFZ24_03365 [Planctomycetota bacterium]|nr:hypothetical protein [Planctomycetota bacterium]